MKILKAAIAGTLESSDAMVTVEPYDSGIALSLESVVINRYGRQIRNIAEETFRRLNVESGRISIVDKGALECTLIARIECAVFRSANASQENVPWGGAF